MPKRRAARGRRGGGNVGKKAAKVDTDETDAAQLKTDTDSNVEATIGFDELEVADESVNDDTGTEDAVDEVLSLSDDVAESVLQEKTVEENKEQAGEVSSEGGIEGILAVNEAAETELSNSNNDNNNISENTAVDDIKDSGIECTSVSDAENNKVAERDNIDASTVEVPVETDEISETQLETEKTVDQPGKESEQEQVVDDAVKNSIEEEILSSEQKNSEPCVSFDDKEVADTDVCFADKAVEGDQKEVEEQQGEEPCLPFDDNEVTDTDVCFADKEVEGDQKEIEEVQYIDEEASEDQTSMDVLEIISSEMTVTSAKSELQIIIELGKSSENPIELDEIDEVPAGLTEADLQKDEEIDNSKFEEISEGSIDQEDQEELIAEPISDVEITGESFEPKKAAKTSNVKEESKKPRYKEAESLEEVFFATENDFLKITAEDKDNDDVSDTSLSNHADANLSLEEISDDDLEPSKKRKKSGLTPVKAASAEEQTTPDVDSKTAENSEVKPNQKSTSSQKRPANDDDDDESPEGTANKRLKATNETKDGEETPARTESEVTGDAKKDVKKPQVKESDAFHGRNVAHNRNVSQSSKNGQQESRERAVPSRDSVEHKRRYELVSTMCQTEPRQLKGKIVQCNINPVRSVPEPLERFTEKTVVESRLLTKFRKQLPSSIPEKVFLAVTSLQPPQLDNAYSFSMGPVTLSDMDCPKFRFAMTGMEEFSLVFDKHTQGIQKATLSSHDRMTSLIGHLKNLELGNRYMVMSVVYRCGFGRTVSVWKATLLFMYEQDIQLESSTLVTDGKIRAKLCLRGVPKDVSKDFIHLLFPETINVCTVQGPLGERKIILGFSHEKIVEEIISCYDLLIICGSQITLSRVDDQETQQSLLPDGSEESKAIPIEDIQDGKGKALEIRAESFVEETQQKDLQSQADKIVVQDSDKTEDSNQDQISQKNHEAVTLSEGSVTSQEQGKNDTSTRESQSADSIDTCAGDTLTASEVILSEITTDSTAASEKLLVDNIEDTSGKIQADDVTVVLGLEQDKEETSRASSAENSTCLDGGSIDNPSESPLGDVASLEAPTDEASKLESDQQNTTEPAVLKVADSVDQMAVGNLSDGAEPLSKTTDDGSNKQESDRQGGECPEKEIPSDTDADVTLTDVTMTDAAADGGERKIDDKTTDDNKSGNVNTEEEVANQEKLDKTFEDISDDETGNQSKHDDPDEVVILKQESPDWEVTEIDLTVEESDTSGKVTENVKPPTQEKVLQPSSKPEAPHDTIVKKASGETEVKNGDPKLVMTDGDLEISMEVIDVNEGEQQTEKVIYARTNRQSPDRSRERKSWDARNYKTTPHVQQPWKENQWSDSGRSGAYYSSHEPYKPYYPPKESSYKMHYYPGPAPDEVSYYRAPVRESTSYRRDPYYYKQKSHRNSSPSPRREMNQHRHSSSRDHRTSDHWDRRYDTWRPSPYKDSKNPEPYSRPPPEYSSRQAYWQAHSTSHHSPPPPVEAPYSSARPRDHYTRGGSRGPYESDRKRKSRKSRSRSLSDMSMSSAELLSPVRKPSYRRESPKRPAAHTSRSPISVSSRSRSLSPVSKSPSLEYTQPGTGKDKLVKTVKHFLELAKGIKQAHRRQSNRSPSPKSPPLGRSKSPQHSRYRSPSVSSSTLRRALHSPRHTESRRQRSKSPHQVYARKSRSPVYSKSHKRRYDRSSSGSSHGDDYKRRYKERYSDKRTGSYHRQSPDRRHESRKAQKTETSHTASDQSGKAKSGQWSDSKYKSSNTQSWQQQPFGSYPVAPSSGPVASSAVYNPTYPPPGCPPQPPTNVYSSSSVPVYPYTSASQFYSNIPPPYLHVPPPAPVAQTYQPPPYTVYQPGQQYAPLQAGSSSSMNLNASNASSKTKSWSMGNSAMVFQRVLGTDKKGGKANKSGVISKIGDRERLERPKVTKTERVLTTVQMEKK